MIEISIAVASNRYEFLQRFCNSFLRDTIVRERPRELEVIFVGPIQDEPWRYKIPVRFIRSDANAALCWEIGARAAHGRLLGLAADDCVFGDGFLDAALAMSKTAAAEGRKYDMWTGRFTMNSRCMLKNQRFMSLPRMPLLPIGGFAFTATHHELGGIDSRFHAVLWDIDLYMSFIEAGGTCHLVGDHTCHEVNPVSKLFKENAPRDREVLKSMWLKDGVAQLTRNSPRKPYDSKWAGVQPITTI